MSLEDIYDFAGWLAERMAARKLSQRQVAMLTDVDHSTISRILKREHRPWLSTAQKIYRVMAK